MQVKCNIQGCPCSYFSVVEKQWALHKLSVYFVAHDSNQIHNSQILFLSDTALHVSGVTITHRQEHKTTVTTASGNRYTVLLSVAIVEEQELICKATDLQSKSVPTLPRQQQTTIRCNGYQMLQLQLFCVPDDG